MENLLRKKKRLSPRVISLIITAAIILQLVIVAGAVAFKRTDLIRFINKNSTMVYERESLFSPFNFKTVKISNDNNTSLGYSLHDNGIYYCIHSDKEYTQTFYIKDIKGNVVYDQEHKIKAKAEIIFKEKDIQKGAALDGYVYFFADAYGIEVAELKVKMTVDRIYTNRVSFKMDNTLSVGSVFTQYDYTGFDAMGQTMLRECFETFNNFLITHDFERFHRSKFHPSRFD